MLLLLVVEILQVYYHIIRNSDITWLREHASVRPTSSTDRELLHCIIAMYIILAWRPAERSTSQDVDMEMHHLLSPIRSVIHHNASAVAESQGLVSRDCRSGDL